jgi:hypothetical protein
VTDKTLLALTALLATLTGHGVGCAQQAMPFDLKDNLVHVPAKVDGRAVSAVLDSGAGQVIIDRTAAKRLGISVAEPAGSATGGGGGPQALFPITLSDVQVGSVTLSKLPGFAVDLEPLSKSAEFPVEALLGGPIFSGRRIDINYRTRQVTFDPPESITCKNPIPITVSNGVPIVEVSVRTKADEKPRKLHLIVDLGTRHFAAMIGGPFLESDSGTLLLKGAHIEHIATGTGGVVNGSVTQISEMTIGDQRFREVRVALTKEVKAFQIGFVDGTLGVPLWSTGGIAFDYPNRQVCLDP